MSSARSIETPCLQSVSRIVAQHELVRDEAQACNMVFPMGSVGSVEPVT